MATPSALMENRKCFFILRIQIEDETPSFSSPMFPRLLFSAFQINCIVMSNVIQIDKAAAAWIGED